MSQEDKSKKKKSSKLKKALNKIKKAVRGKKGIDRSDSSSIIESTDSSLSQGRWEENALYEASTPSAMEEPINAEMNLSLYGKAQELLLKDFKSGMSQNGLPEKEKPNLYNELHIHIIDKLREATKQLQKNQNAVAEMYESLGLDYEKYLKIKDESEEFKKTLNEDVQQIANQAIESVAAELGKSKGSDYAKMNLREGFNQPTPEEHEYDQVYIDRDGTIRTGSPSAEELKYGEISATPIDGAEPKYDEVTIESAGQKTSQAASDYAVPKGTPVEAAGEESLYDEPRRVATEELVGRTKTSKEGLYAKMNLRKGFKQPTSEDPTYDTVGVSSQEENIYEDLSHANGPPVESFYDTTKTKGAAAPDGHTYEEMKPQNIYEDMSDANGPKSKSTLTAAPGDQTYTKMELRSGAKAQPPKVDDTYDVVDDASLKRVANYQWEILKDKKISPNEKRQEFFKQMVDYADSMIKNPSRYGSVSKIREQFNLPEGEFPEDLHLIGMGSPLRKQFVEHIEKISSESVKGFPPEIAKKPAKASPSHEPGPVAEPKLAPEEPLTEVQKLAKNFGALHIEQKAPSQGQSTKEPQKTLKPTLLTKAEEKHQDPEMQQLLNQITEYLNIEFPHENYTEYISDEFKQKFNMKIDTKEFAAAEKDVNKFLSSDAFKKAFSDMEEKVKLDREVQEMCSLAEARNTPKEQLTRDQAKLLYQKALKEMTQKTNAAREKKPKAFKEVMPKRKSTSGRGNAS